MRKNNDTDSLVALASANEKSRIASVLAAATDLFALSANHDQTSIRQFSELATNLLPKVDEALRRRMSSLLAGHPQTPHAVLEMLARDVIAVATPVLCTENKLTAGFLLTLIELREPDRTLAISKRPDLDDVVLDAVGSSEPAALPAQNTGVADDLRSEPPVEADASSPKTALPARGAVLLSEASQSLEYFLSLSSAERLQLIADSERDELRKQAEGNRQTSIEPRGERIETGLIQLAAGADLDQCSPMIAELCDIEWPMATRLLTDPGGEALAVALVAAGVSGKTITSLLLLTNQTVPKSDERIRALVKLVEGLSPGAALRLARGEQPDRNKSAHRGQTLVTRKDADGASQQDAAAKPAAASQTTSSSQQR